MSDLRQPLNGLDYATRDYEGFKHLMLTKLKEKIPEYADFSENDLGVVLIELLALGQDIQSYYIDKIANEVNLSTATDRQNIVELCANLGYTLSNATPSIFDQVFEVEPSNVDTVIPERFAITTADNGFDEVLTFETVEQLIIPPNCTGLEKDEEGNYLYTVEVVQGKTIPEELLGTSNNLPNQEFPLWESPVIASQVEVLVNEGYGFEAWTYVPSFLQSNINDKHFTLMVDGSSNAKVVFGNGTLGAIPNSYADGIIAKYRVGGGSKCNVKSEVISQIVQPLAFIKRTFNPTIAKVRGEDVEHIEKAKSNAVRSLRTLDRAVSLQDYKDVAFQLPFTLISDVAEVDDGRSLNIYIVSKYGDTLSSEELEEAQELYNRVRMTGVIPLIKDATYVPLNFHIEVCKYKKDYEDYTSIVPSILTDYFSLGNFNFQQKYSQSALLKELMLLLPNTQDINVSLTTPAPILLEGQIYTLGTVTVEVVQ